MNTWTQTRVPGWSVKVVAVENSSQDHQIPQDLFTLAVSPCSSQGQVLRSRCHPIQLTPQYRALSLIPICLTTPAPHQPARADYSPSCQADMAAIRPPLTVSGASQASLRHPPASFGIRPRCFLAAAAPSASRYGSSRSPCELRKPRSSVPLRTGPVSRNCNAWGQIDTILVHK